MPVMEKARKEKKNSGFHVELLSATSQNEKQIPPFPHTHP